MKKHFYLSFFGDKKASKKSGRGNCPGPNYTVSIVKPILRIRTEINFGTRLCKNSRTGKVRFQDRVPRLFFSKIKGAKRYVLNWLFFIIDMDFLKHQFL